MEIKSQVLVVALTCLCLTFHQVSGALFRGKGCGPGRKYGDTWSFTHCGVCTCYENDEYSCSTCGTMTLAPKKDCYVDWFRKDTIYPECCSKGYICIGDPGFNSQKFFDYWKNNVIG